MSETSNIRTTPFEQIDFVRLHRVAFRYAFEYLEKHWPPVNTNEYWEEIAKELGPITGRFDTENLLGKRLVMAVFEYLEDVVKTWERGWSEEAAREADNAPMVGDEQTRKPGTDDGEYTRKPRTGRYEAQTGTEQPAQPRTPPTEQTESNATPHTEQTETNTPPLTEQTTLGI